MSAHPQCPACQGFVSTGGGRCPTCGEMLPDFSDRRAEPRRGVATRPEQASKSMGPVILLSVAVLAAGAAILYWTLGPQPETAATGSAAPPLPSAVNEITARSFDADQSLANAWRKARAWDPDAALASLTISSVSSGKPDPSSILVATFAKRKGRFGPGAEVGSARYVVTVTLDNQKTGTSKSNGLRWPSWSAKPTTWSAGTGASLPCRWRLWYGEANVVKKCLKIMFRCSVGATGVLLEE